MRYYIAIIIMLCSLNCIAQKRTAPTGNPQVNNFLYNRMNGYLLVDSAYLYTPRDTSWKPISGKSGVIINASDTLPYFWNFNKWNGFTTGSNSNYTKYTDSTTIFVTPTQLEDSLGNYVTLNTFQVVPISKTWNHIHTFTDSVGIGAAPTTIFDVTHNDAALRFDGVRLTLYDDVTDDNLLIGRSTGGTNLTSENIGVGALALKNVTGASNIAIGVGNLSSFGTAGSNVAIGNRALQLSNGSDNTAVGHFAGVTTFGDSNTVIGYVATAAALTNNTNINNSEIVIGTNTYSGAQTTSWITANTLVVGQRYPVLIRFNGTIPSPFTSATTYANAGIINSSTVQLDIDLFTSQGTSTTTFSLYNKQHNSIAIGTAAHTDSSNQISIGNSANTALKANNLAVDISTAPSNGDVLIYNSTSGMYVPLSASGRSGQTTLVLGTKAIPITGLTTSSKAQVTLVSQSSAALTIQYSAVCTLNTLTISALTATGDNTINTADVSTLNFFIPN
jgi:hypothetical protein